ncbi:spore germination protein GerKB [Desulfotomaculum defluvii]
MKNKISAKQAVFLVATCILATIDVFIPSEVAQSAGRDAWLSVLIAAVIGYSMFRLILLLCSLFPNHTLAGFNRLLLGKYLGGVVTGIYIVAFLIFCAIAMVEVAIIIPTAFKPGSSIYLWDLTLLLPALYVASLGISIPARMNELLLPLGLLILVVVVVFNIPYINLKEYLPVLAKGYLPPLAGAYNIGGKLGFSLLYFAIFPLIEHKYKLKRIGNLITPVLVFAILSGTLAISIFGPALTGMMIFPALEMVRNIDIGFITRLDALMMMIWYTGFLIYVAAFSYGAAALTKDLFNLKSYRLVLWLYGLVILWIANFQIVNVPLIRTMFLTPLSNMVYILGFVVPLILYLVARLRGFSKEVEQVTNNT